MRQEKRMILSAFRLWKDRVVKVWIYKKRVRRLIQLIRN